MIERVSKEIGALSDLVKENEAKGRLGQVRTEGYLNRGVLEGCSR